MFQKTRQYVKALLVPLVVGILVLCIDCSEDNIMCSAYYVARFRKNMKSDNDRHILWLWKIASDGYLRDGFCWNLFG